MALMTWPLTSDGAGAVTYTANEWRTLVTNLFGEGVLGAGSFEVTERAAGANMTLDIAAGVAALTGDDAAGQGRYLIRDDAADTEAVTITTAHSTNPRIDLVGIQLNDPSEGGAAGRNAVFAVVTGTAASSPSAPAVPDSFLTLASVLVPAGATSIEDADITDARTHAALAHDGLLDSVFGATPGVPTAFTPAFTSTGTAPTLGSGSSAAGKYATVAQVVSGVGRIVFGSSGVAAGTGSYRVSLPVAASTTHQTVSTGPGNGSVIGTGTFVDDSGSNVYTVALHMISATTASLLVVGTGTVFTATTPVAPAANDIITYQFSYFTD